MIKPIFSIIIPTYNSSKTVNKTIRSVLNQSFKRYEVIIIDDGSTDNTVSKIKDFNDSRIKLIKIQRTGGPAKPRNIGIELAKSNWICFLDSDDFWNKHKLSISYENIKNNKFDILCHNEYLLKNNILKISQYGPFKNNFYKHLLINGNLLSTSATIISKKFLKKNKLKFNESKNFVSVEDYDLWMLLAKNDAKFFFIKDILGTYLIHNKGISYNNYKHLNYLKKLLFYHVFYVQKFEKNKKLLWQYLKKKIQILHLLNNFRENPFNIPVMFKLFSFVTINPFFFIKFYVRKLIK